MRVVIVMPHPIRPTVSGDRIRSVELLGKLRERGVDAWLACWSWGGAAKGGAYEVCISGRPEKAAPQVGWRIGLGIGRILSPHAIYESPGNRRRLLALIESLRPDIVDFQHSYMWMPTSIPHVVTFHNVESVRLSQVSRPPTKGRLNKIRSREREAIRESGAAIVFSKTDRERLMGLSPESSRKVFEVPLGYDPGAPDRVPTHESIRRVAFVGSFPYEPNLHAARILINDWPRLARLTGVEKLVIIGSSAAKYLSPGPNIEIHSDVPNVAEVLRSCDVLLAPVPSGGGVRVKVIEAFALGIPVISTPVGVEGLEAVPGVHLELAVDFQGIVAAIRRLQPLAVRESMAGQARRLWTDRHSPAVMAERMSNIYNSIISAGASYSPAV